MGWGYGINKEGREVGYSVDAICDEPECDVEIDRGLSYVCGGMHDGGDYGCGKYFCEKHLYSGEHCQLCGECEKDDPMVEDFDDDDIDIEGTKIMQEEFKNARRLKILTVPVNMFLWTLQNNTDEPLTLSQVTDNPLPSDCKVVGFSTSAKDTSDSGSAIIELTVQSNEFDEVPEGHGVPEHPEIKLKRIRVSEI